MIAVARLRELLEACTEGPWSVERFGFYANVMGPDAHVVYDGEYAEQTNEHRGASSLADATFIAEARNALPDLLAVCEAARAVPHIPDANDAENWHVWADWATEGGHPGCKMCAALVALENLEGGAG